MTSRRDRATFAASTAAMDLATTARTALAATHGGRLHLPGSISEEVGFLDDDGEPLIVRYADGPPPRGRACLSVTAGPRRRIVLAGRLYAHRPASEDVTELLGEHEACFAQACPTRPVQIVRLSVDEIRIEDGASSSTVSCADYAAAEPDLWGAFALTVAEHLDSDHGDVLAALARLHLPDQRVVAAAIAGLQRDVLTLDVVTPDGATRLVLPLHARVDDPHELCGRLLEVAAPRAGDRWHLEDR